MLDDDNKTQCLDYRIPFVTQIAPSSLRSWVGDIDTTSATRNLTFFSFFTDDIVIPGFAGII